MIVALKQNSVVFHFCERVHCFAKIHLLMMSVSANFTRSSRLSRKDLTSCII
jgi:hypothetical protein